MATGSKSKQCGRYVRYVQDTTFIILQTRRGYMTSGLVPDILFTDGG